MAEFVNLDAKFLFDLGQTFIEDEDLETGLRLQSSAHRLEAFDEKSRNLSITDDYLRGKAAAFAEVYDRSNLPIEERAMPVAAARLGFGSNARVQKIPMGVSGTAEPKQRKPSKIPAALQGLKLKINLPGLKKEN